MLEKIESVSSPQTEEKRCPSCQKEILNGQKECFGCGIVFENYAKFQFEKDMKEKVGGLDHLEAPSLKKLDQSWKKLVVNYHDQQGHGRVFGDMPQARGHPLCRFLL